MGAAVRPRMEIRHPRVRCPSGALGKHDTLRPHSSRFLEQIKGLCYFSFLTLSVRSWFEAFQGGKGWWFCCWSSFSSPVITCLPSWSLPRCDTLARAAPLTTAASVPGVLPCLFHLSSHLSKPGRRGYPHFTSEESEAQAGKVSCPRSHSWQVAETGFSLSPTGSLSSTSYVTES